jgi:hypothetical protein
MAKRELDIKLRDLLTPESQEVFDSIPLDDLIQADKISVNADGSKGYSPEVRENAINLLVEHRLNWRKVQNITGIDRETLKHWFNAHKVEIGFDLREALENIAYVLVQEVPKFNSGKDWAIALGIIVEKLALLNGLANPENNNVKQVNFNFANMLGVNAADLGAYLIEQQAVIERYRQQQQRALEDSENEPVSGTAVTIEPAEPDKKAE